MILRTQDGNKLDKVAGMADKIIDYSKAYILYTSMVTVTADA